jgi:hypothetical protein
VPAARWSRRSIWLAGAGLLAGALTQLLNETPAEWLSDAVAAASGRQLALAAVSGGLLAGEAGLQWNRAGSAPLGLGRWRWQLAWPMDLQPSWRVASLSGPLQAHAVVSIGAAAAQLTELEADCSASALPAGLAALELLHPGGEVHLTAARLEVSAIGMAGSGVLAWRHASTPLAGQAELGSWSARWTLAGREGDFRLSTETGPLHLEGSGRIALDGRLGLHGRAWADPASNGTLEPVLRMLGPLGDDGSAAIEWPWRPS